MANWFKRFLNLDDPSPNSSDSTGVSSYSAPPSFSPVISYSGDSEQLGAQSSSVPQQAASGPIATAAGEPIPVSDALRMAVRGVLPPQGLAPFLQELRSTTGEVAELYTSWSRFLLGDLIPRALLEEPKTERRRESSPRPIAIDRQGGNGGSRGPSRPVGEPEKS